MNDKTFIGLSARLLAFPFACCIHLLSKRRHPLRLSDLSAVVKLHYNSLPRRNRINIIVNDQVIIKQARVGCGIRNHASKLLGNHEF